QQEALVEQLEKKVGFPMKHKPYRSLDEIMSEYRRRHPDLDWETRDEDWFRVEQDRRLVRAYLSKGVEGIDRLVASILPHRILKDGRLVRDCFKVLSCSNQHMETAYFCPENRQWQLESPG
ncbi:unnamed protein product, partial [Effrenium voratum]